MPQNVTSENDKWNLKRIPFEEEFILLKVETNEIVIRVPVQCSISENLDPKVFHIEFFFTPEKLQPKGPNGIR